MLSTAPLRREIQEALPDRPFSVQLWDGTSVPPTRPGGPTFHLRSPLALAHALRAPGQLGLGRAYVSGAIDVDDIDLTLGLLDDFAPAPIAGVRRARLVTAAVRAGALLQVPRTPAAELRPHGKRHTIARDRRATRHHYDISNDFFALFLGESLTYSCAIFSRGATTLDQAQFAKRELICTKLGLESGHRVLDIGCGWGSFAIHAAQEHGAHVTGITLSEPQAQGARERAEAAGVGDLVDIRVADYREFSGERFDAISSIGMIEHVGDVQIDEYARCVAALLEPGGQLLNHGIARLRHSGTTPGPFSERYVFPDGDPLPLSRVLRALELAGFATQHVEGFADDYAETLRHWERSLDAHAAAAEALVGSERLRVWRVYLRAARRGFENGFTSIYQVRAGLVGAALPGSTISGA